MLRLRTIRSPCHKALRPTRLSLSTLSRPTQLSFNKITSSLHLFHRKFTVSRPVCQPVKHDRDEPETQNEPLNAAIYTLPNLLTLSRIISCPVLGYAILQDNFYLATSLLVYAGFTDLVSDIHLSLGLTDCRVSGRWMARAKVQYGVGIGNNLRPSCRQDIDDYVGCYIDDERPSSSCVFNIVRTHFS